MISDTDDSMQRYINYPAKHRRWRFFEYGSRLSSFNCFLKSTIVDVWQGNEYTSEIFVKFQKPPLKLKFVIMKNLSLLWFVF